jgi:hypothetical protein
VRGRLFGARYCAANPGVSELARGMPQKTSFALSNLAFTAVAYPTSDEWNVPRKAGMESNEGIRFVTDLSRAQNAVDIVPPSIDALWAYFARPHHWGWIYRGMSSELHSPVSSLERLLHGNRIDPVNAKRMENRGLAFFRQRARLHLKTTPDDEDWLGWLTLMQHYGGPTRLTDWTYSPFVALFFAYQALPEGPDAPDAAIWMLHAPLLREVFPGGPIKEAVPDLAGIDPDSGFGPREVRASKPVLTAELVEAENAVLRELVRREISWPVPLSILRPDVRMVAQQACFVCMGQLSVDGRSPLQRLFNRETLWETLGAIDPSLVAGAVGDITTGVIGPRFVYQDPRSVFGRIRLPGAWRKDVLTTLARMNVTADVLFPGLDGVGRATALHMLTAAPPLPEYYMHGS